VADGEFGQIGGSGAVTRVRLQLPKEFEGIVVVVGSTGSPGKQFLPVNVPLLINREEVNQIAPEAAG
jgi:hypothetical protein